MPFLAVKDSNGNDLIVGDKYELYVPVAKMASKELGLSWKDEVGYSFTYRGATDLRGTVYICTSDVTYIGGSDKYLAACARVTAALDGNIPLCPDFVARKFIRPVTYE